MLEREKWEKWEIFVREKLQTKNKFKRESQAESKIRIREIKKN